MRKLGKLIHRPSLRRWWCPFLIHLLYSPFVVLSLTVTPPRRHGHGSASENELLDGFAAVQVEPLLDGCDGGPVGSFVEGPTVLGAGWHHILQPVEVIGKLLRNH